MTATTTAYATGHVGLNVSDLDRSVEVYRQVFGWEVTTRNDEAERRFAFLADGPRLVVTLWEQSDGRFPTDQPGLHHLSFEVGSIEEVRATEERVRAAGLRLHHDGVVPHSEGLTSGGIFFEDPDGIRLEVFAAAGADAGHAAPSGAAPTCGFF